jgi:hypothetical protein
MVKKSDAPSVAEQPAAVDSSSEAQPSHPQRSFEVVSIVSSDITDVVSTLGKDIKKVKGPQPSVVVKKIMTKLFKEDKQVTSARITLSEKSARRGECSCTYDALVKKYNKKPSFSPNGSSKTVTPSFQIITQRVIS